MAEAANVAGVFINLDRATERRAGIEAQLSRLRLPYWFERFAGVDGKLQTRLPGKLTPGQYGCWLSHLAVLERSLNDDRNLHVIEDDAIISAKLEVIPDALRALTDAGEAWDILYLDATLVEILDMTRMFEWVQASRQEGAVHVHKIPPDFTLYGMLSYIVNSSRKKHVHDFLQARLES